MYDSVTLAHCVALPYGYSLPHTIGEPRLPINPHCGSLRCSRRFGTSYVRKHSYGSSAPGDSMSLCGCPLLLFSLWISPCSAPQLGKSYVRKKRCSESVVVSLPPSSALLFPMPSYTDTYIDNTSTTLAGGVS